MKMKIKYTYLDHYFCECEEGSMIDLAIQSIEVEERKRYSRVVQQAIKANKPIPYPKRNESRDILTHVERE